jgi:hypothetical protein
MDEFDLDAHSLRPKEDSSTLKENYVISYFMDESPGGQDMAAYRLIRRK